MTYINELGQQMELQVHLEAKKPKEKCVTT